MPYPEIGSAVDNTARTLATESLSTGLLTGGVISINANSTSVDITAGSGRIVDASDPSNITSQLVTWGAKTAVPITNIATQLVTFLSIDSDGNVVESGTFPENGQLRQEIVIGSAVHSNMSTINNVSQFTSIRPFQYAPALTALVDALGVINLAGNVASGVSSTLSVAKTSGKMYFGGIKRDPLQPDVISTPSSNVPTITFVWRDGSGGFNTSSSTVVTAGVFDDNSGGVNNPSGSLSTNSWTNHRLYYSPDLDQFFLEYGQFSYNTSDDAIASLRSETRVSTPALVEVPIISAITMRGGASDLSVIADALFTQANKLAFF